MTKVDRVKKQRRNNLLEAMELGEFGRYEVLDRLNNIKRLRQEDEFRLNDLWKTREHLTSLANVNIKLNELYSRVLDNLEHNCTVNWIERETLINGDLFLAYMQNRLPDGHDQQDKGD